jgi:rubrerythrin
MSTGAKPTPALTLDNLQKAFNGESNARARYLAFSAKAELEGYHRIASLFRAAARAEEIHASNHAAVIRKLGAEPVCKIETPVIHTTRENLGIAIQGETYERDIMYPEMIKTAQAEKITAAIRTFQHALEAEAEHARLYTDALDNLEQMKTKTVYYICPVCGFTVEKPAFERCPVCNHPRERFLEID